MQVCVYLKCIYSHRSHWATLFFFGDTTFPLSLPLKFHNSGWLWWASASALPALLIFFVLFFFFSPNAANYA